MTDGRHIQGHILTVLNYYHPYVSGLTEYARLVSEGAASRGFSITVLTGRHAPDLPEVEIVGGVQVLRANPLAFLHKGYISFQLFQHFVKQIGSVDVVHFHLPMLESGLLAVLGSPSVPMLTTYHCDVQRSRSGTLVDAAAVAAVRGSCRLCLKRSRLIAVSSTDYASGSKVLRGTSRKWVEIPPPDKGSTARPLAPKTDATVRIGFLGRFVEEKGIDVLLEAAPLVLRRFPQAQFILAGSFVGVAGGSEYHRLRDRIESLGSSVQTPGYIPEEQLQEFYSSLNAFILPSVTSYEAFGMVQVEAMKAGVPVVASDMRGVRIPVQRTGNGILVPPRATTLLADAIIKVLTEPRFQARAEISARAWAAFSSDRIMDQYAELYSVLGKTGKRNTPGK